MRVTGYKYKQQQEHDAIDTPMVFYGRAKWATIVVMISTIFIPSVSVGVSLILAIFGYIFLLLELKWIGRHYNWHKENDR